MDENQTTGLLTLLSRATLYPSNVVGRIAIAPMFLCNRRLVNWRPAFRAEDCFWISTLGVDPNPEFPWFIFHLSVHPTKIDRSLGEWHIMNPGDELWIIPNTLTPEWKLIPYGTPAPQP